MGKSRLSRRRFLRDSGLGAGAAAGLSVLGGAALPTRAMAADPPPAPPVPAPRAAVEDALLFLSRPQARTVEAVASRIWPDLDGIGVRELGVLTYVDRA